MGLPVSTGFDRLHEVRLLTPHFNITGHSCNVETYKTWVSTLGPLQEALRCYEMVLDDDAPEIDGSIVVRGTRKKNAMWQQEPLLNIGVRDCDPDIKYIGMLDHDTVFTVKDWLAQAVDYIDHGAVAVQLFNRIDYLDQQYNKLESTSGFIDSWINWQELKGNPGSQWLFSAEFLREVGGFYPGMILGGADQLLGTILTAAPNDLIPAYSAPLCGSMVQWIRRAISVKSYRLVGYLPHALLHLWHGPLIMRDYEGRNAPLWDHRFNADHDIAVNEAGLVEWITDKPALHKAVYDYFIRRTRDAP